MAGQWQFISEVEEIITQFDSPLISWQHVITMDKDGCNSLEDLTKPITTPDD